MKKTFLLLIWVLLTGASCQRNLPPTRGPANPALEPEPPLAMIHPDQTLQPSRPSLPWTFEMAMINIDGKGVIITYADGDTRRVDQYQGLGKDKKIQSITIITKDAVYGLNPENKTVIKLPPNPERAGDQDNPQAMVEWKTISGQWMRLPGVKIIERGSEQWEGTELKVYRVSNPEQSWSDYYVTGENVIKRIVDYNGEGGQVNDTRLELQFGPLPAGIFDIPPDYRIENRTEKGDTVSK